MDLRNLLAGAAAITLAGTVPAAAQAPRSLFEAAPADSAPVTMGLEKTSPTPSAKPAAPAPAKTARVEEPAAPSIAVAPTKPDAAASAKPAVAAAKEKPRRQRLASRQDASQPLPAEPAPGFEQAAPQAAAEKPLSRAERRRARHEARRHPAAPEAAAAPVTPPAPANPFLALFGSQSSLAGIGTPSQASGAGPRSASRAQIDSLVAQHARLNNVPESLVHRIIVRESKYNPGAVGRGGAMGLMQIKTATARGMGYAGGPAGLLDAETNIKYAVKYLAGAWRVSGGSHDRAVGYYARGYYYEAKRQGLAGPRGRRGEPESTTTAAAPQAPSLLSLFR